MKLYTIEKAIIQFIGSLIAWVSKGKRLLIFGFILASISTVLGVSNNYEWFHKHFDNFPIWNNFNQGVKGLMQISDSPQIQDIDGIQKIVLESGVPTHLTKPRVLYLMNTNTGFKQMRDLIVNNLLTRPTYKINAIINEQVSHIGKNPKNPYLSQSIVSLIPVPSSGESYKTITAAAYSERDDVTTESFLAEWVKNYKKKVVLNFCLMLFAVGFLCQMVYHLKTNK